MYSGKIANRMWENALWLALWHVGFCSLAQDRSDDFHTLPASVVEDKIHGGLLGQILGNLNGLPHEFKYLDEPGDVRHYVPALPDGAWTDDDTDIEWVYVVAMQQRRELFLSPEVITQLWRKHINRRIWSSNQYVRQLLDLGFQPPYTGLKELNPWAEFNIAGQFCCECFGLIAPGMPQWAAQLGCHYTSVVVSGEPLQATQLFTTMIATAFVTNDVNEIIDAGERALDPNSRVLEVVRRVRAWHRQHPDDWRATRRNVKETYDVFGKSHRGRNGYELNTAGVLTALLYGQGDFQKTMEVAFSFGWDADCNAATAGTIIGVLKGYTWFEKQGWKLTGVYKNTCREGMPDDETISHFSKRLAELAELAVTKAGGFIKKGPGKDQCYFVIPKQTPKSVRPLAHDEMLLTKLKREYSVEKLAAMLRDSDLEKRAQAAYLTIAFNRYKELEQVTPQGWKQALAALEMFPKVVQAIYYYTPATERTELLRKCAQQAGLIRPAKKIPLW